MVFMLLNKRFSSDSLLVILLLVVSSLLFSCSSVKEAELLRQNKILQEKNIELAAELAKESTETASLQMKLVEKQMENDSIKITQEHLTQEIVDTKARIPTPKTKVEVVAYLAEAETDINTVKELASDSEQLLFVQIDRLIAESKVEFEKGNYATALSRASQAVELTQAIRVKTALNRRMEDSVYEKFILPLHLQLARRGNIRKNPTIRGKILTTLSPGTPAIAIGYQGDWIKVTFKNGQEGWIHYSLLAVPGTTLTFPKPVK